jgi:hypothetical protein
MWLQVKYEVNDVKDLCCLEIVPITIIVKKYLIFYEFCTLLLVCVILFFELSHYKEARIVQ